MPESLGDAYVTLRSDGSQVQSDIETQLTKALGPVVAKGAKILAGLFVGKEALGFAREGITELVDAEKQSALTAAQLKATGGAAGITQAHIEDLAAANLKLAGTSDEVTIGAERILLQFNRVTAVGGVFDEALASAQDLAIVTGQDLPSAARTLGLALQDPSKALRLLRADNIALNATQQEQIKAFDAAGDVLGAQRVILDAVTAAVGGTSAAYGQTLAGDLQRAQSELTETKKSLVEGAAPALKLVADATSSLSEEVQALPGPVRTVASSFLAVGVAAVSLGPTLLGLRSAYVSLKAAKATLAATDSEEAGSMAVNTAAIESNTTALLLNATAAQRAAFAQNMIVEEAPAVVAAEESIGVGATAMLGPIGLAIAAAAALTYAFTHFGGADFSIDLKGAVPSVQQFGAALEDAKFKAIGSAVGFAQVAAQIAEKSVPAARNFNEALRAQGLSTDEVTAAIDKQDAKNKAATAGTQGLTVAEYDQAAAEKALADEQKARFDAITGSVSAEQAYERTLRDVASAVRGTESATRSLEDAQKKLNEARQGASVEELSKAELSLESAQINSGLAAKTLTDEETKLDQLRHGASGTVAELTSAEQSLAQARESQRKANQSLDELERTARINARRGIAETHEQRIAIADAARSAQDAAKATATEEAKLAVLRAPGTAQQIADQETKVAQAKIATQQATFAVTDSETALQAVQAKGSESDQAVIDARQKVADASQNLADANQRVSDSYQAEIGALAAVGNASDLLKGKTDTAIGRAYNLRQALASVANTYAPGTPERQNIDDEIAKLDQLAVGNAVAQASAQLPQTNALFQALFGKSLFGIHAASGFAGTVNGPTGILAGEGGRPEDVLIVPHSQGGIQTGASVAISVPVSVNFHGVVPSESEAYRSGQAAGAGVADVLERRAVQLAKRIA